MFSFPTHAHCLLALRFFEYHPKLLRITYIVRFRQDTGISSPSLYPSPPVALVLPAVDPIGNSAPARNSRAMWEGRRLNGRGADMLASLFDSCNARELLRGGELMKGRRQRGEDTELFLPAAACGGGWLWLGLITSQASNYPLRYLTYNTLKCDYGINRILSMAHLLGTKPLPIVHH